MRAGGEGMRHFRNFTVTKFQDLNMANGSDKDKEFRSIGRLFSL